MCSNCISHLGLCCSDFLNMSFLENPQLLKFESQICNYMDREDNNGNCKCLNIAFERCRIYVRTVNSWFFLLLQLKTGQTCVCFVIHFTSLHSLSLLHCTFHWIRHSLAPPPPASGGQLRAVRGESAGGARALQSSVQCVQYWEQLTARNRFVPAGSELPPPPALSCWIYTAFFVILLILQFHHFLRLCSCLCFCLRLGLFLCLFSDME